MDLNATCSKNPYPIPNIYFLIKGSSGYKTLIFMDAYLGCNQIKMDPVDEPKAVFVWNQGSYYYNVTPFGLKNT